MPAQTPSERRLILLEFNELCPGLIDKFISEGALPNFKRLREMSDTFVTHTTEEVLEPWIQWVTVHTGVPVSEHRIMDLDEADKLNHKPFWDDLQDANVLLVSPMNVKFSRADRSIFIPDPWAASQSPSPEVKPFCKFIRSAITGHARTDRFNASDAWGAIRFLAGHGVTWDSIRGAVTQLAQERSSNRDVKWRRATILDRLLWDVFAHFWKGPRRPRVGVFFSNATAHYQHKYWAHHDPSIFALKPSQAELDTYGAAIRFGYQAHDRLIGKALALADGNTTVALCTALSQQPMRDYEARGGKAMFIPKDYGALLPALGVTARFRAEALMAEESWLHFDSKEEQQTALAILLAAKTSDGRQLLKVRSTEDNSCIVGCDVFAAEVTPQTQIVTSSGARVSFAAHFLPMPTVTSAKHHPDGVFWIARPNRRAAVAGAEPRLPLTQVRVKLEQALAL